MNKNAPRHKRWTDAEIKLLRQLAKQKKSGADIARRLKRSAQAIYIRGSVLKIRFRSES